MRNIGPKNFLAISSSLLVVGAMVASAQSALADGMQTRHVVRHHYYYSRLAPERHVLFGQRSVIAKKVTLEPRADRRRRAYVVIDRNIEHGGRRRV